MNAAPPPEAEPSPLLSVSGLSCVRRGRTLFSGLGFSLPAGRWARVTGRNGKGKTSLLRILAGLIVPESGEIRWRGRDIHEERSAFVRELCFLGHLPGIKGELTPWENLQVARCLSGGEARLDTDQALAEVGLAGLEDVPVRTLSAGQQRRVGLARLLVSGALLWVMDEPFTSLDREGIALVRSLVARHLEAGGLAVITTHHEMELAGKAPLDIDLGWD